jgi:membrane peptidoglycan carboxypeptidase
MTRRNWFWLAFGLAFLGLASIAAYELIASPFQAMFLSDYAKRLNYRDASGPSDSIRFPKFGPYDIRLGYTLIPGFTDRLDDAGFEIASQARISPEMATLDRFGLFLPYREKSVAGLTLDDCAGNAFYSFRQPRHAYPDFAAVPPVIANTLLFIENKELLDPNHPQRNPAVEWDRLAEAVLEKMVQVVQPGHHVPGGSTLATQIEKYRHSADGLTMTAGDKLRQMASASVRAYLDGPDTRVTRRRIVLDYLNTVPLSAAPGFGEVNGIGDGLKVWFGLDFDQVNRLLAHPEPTPEAALAYKHVLGLLISQRKPSSYLVTNRARLDAQVNIHLGLLAQAGIITPAFRDMALREHIHFRDSSQPLNDMVYTRQKAATATRNALSKLLGVNQLYDLDRLDLTVGTSLHAPTQLAISNFLTSLNNPDTAKTYGLYGFRLLSPQDDLNKIIYSFTLYERTPNGPALRVQADNLNQPFDINQSAKLGMGSSAKLRTLVTYLQIIADLHDKYGDLKPKALAKVKVSDRDPLSQWALAYLRSTPDRDLTAMLRAAMDRQYSANTSEVFFTGGGIHRFANFEKWEDSKVMSIWDAFRNSVNLPFVRLMRDIVHYYMYRSPSSVLDILENQDDPRRTYYLAKFADKEGTDYLIQFHKKYRGMKPDEAESLLLGRLAKTPSRLAAALRYIEPDDDLATFSAHMKARLADASNLDAKDYQSLYETYAPDKFTLADRAYIAKMHPLELWLVAYLHAHPHALWNELHKASTLARQDSYAWLFKTNSKFAQDIRIQSLLEGEAYQEIYQRWRRLGYPFSSIVPSYATAIGSSADRPAALADLMGIVLNNGVKQTSATIRRLDFGAGTPYHTVFVHKDSEPQQLLPPALTQVVREALVNVVTGGTAIRVNGGFDTPDGKLAIGGKTGTGDNRFETFAPNGSVLESRPVNRVATFVFFLGRHFYGVITAFVPGEAAGDYKFTSALPVQILKSMSPILQPLVRAGEARSLGWDEEAAEFEAANAPPPAAAKPAAIIDGTPTAPPPGHEAAPQPSESLPATGTGTVPIKPSGKKVPSPDLPPAVPPAPERNQTVPPPAAPNPVPTPPAPPKPDQIRTPSGDNFMSID